MAAACARAEQGGGGARATNLHAPHLTATAPQARARPSPARALPGCSGRGSGTCRTRPALKGAHAPGTASGGTESTCRVAVFRALTHPSAPRARVTPNPIALALTLTRSPLRAAPRRQRAPSGRGGARVTSPHGPRRTANAPQARGGHEAARVRVRVRGRLQTEAHPQLEPRPPNPRPRPRPRPSRPSTSPPWGRRAGGGRPSPWGGTLGLEGARWVWGCTPCKVCTPRRGQSPRGWGGDFFFLARKKRKKKPETPLYPFL